MKSNTTIKDIAKAAGVSVTAVSMALNNRPGVSDATRKKIVAIAKKLEYYPNYIAKSLISNKSHTLGLVINSIADPFYPELALGIEERAYALGYSLLLCNINRSVTRERHVLRTLRGKGVDGIIITTVTADAPNIEFLMTDRFPFVLVNRQSLRPEHENKIDYVVVDNVSCGYKGMEHLYRLGHDRVALVTGDLSASTARRLTRGARRAKKDLGMDMDPELMAECGFVRDKAYKAAKKMMELKTPPSAFFSQDDYMALGIREAILEKGLRVPEDVALMGIDDTKMSAITGVDLTTMDPKKYEMGVMGVDILVKKIENRMDHVVNQVVLEADLIRRKSCGYHLKGYIREAVNRNA